MESNSGTGNITTSFSFSDFPEDVQVCILSFLNQSELATFASTSKSFLSFCRHDQRLWFSMCDRRWGSKTLIKKWGNGKISYKLLYKALVEFENLIGFWRRCGTTAAGAAVQPPSPPLVFFEWGPFYITGSRVSPSKNGTYQVIKLPFLWISLTSKGESINYLDPQGKLELSSENLVDSGEFGVLENELIPVNVSFMGKCHVVVEESVNLFGNSSNSSPNGRFIKVPSSGNVRGEAYEDDSGSPWSLSDHLMSEIYQHFANRTSSGGNGSSRRQRRREKERQVRRKLEPEHFVKIVNSSPTPARPLQGLWKGICDDMSLEFYLTSYDDTGGIACRRIGESSRPFNDYNPVFGTSNSTLIEPPFSAEEEYEYESRIHLRPPAEADDFHAHQRCSEHGAVSRMLHMTSSYDLAIPGTTINPRQVEGRIWQYKNGTFGFGFLRNNYIIDLKHIAQDGRLLNTMEFSNG